MPFSVSGHRLLEDGAPVTFVETPNQGGPVKPRYLIIHYTAGTRANGAIAHFANPAAKASAHLVIDRDGTVTQMVGFNRIAWHAGKSEWNGLSGINAYSIGIELANAGKLARRADGAWTSWAGSVIPPEEVIIATHKDESREAGWQVFPHAQLESAIAVAIALRQTYGFEAVLGHEDISPGRKVDPGPGFPMISFESQVMGRP